MSTSLLRMSYIWGDQLAGKKYAKPSKKRGGDKEIHKLISNVVNGKIFWPHVESSRIQFQLTPHSL